MNTAVELSVPSLRRLIEQLAKAENVWENIRTVKITKKRTILCCFCYFMMA